MPQTVSGVQPSVLRWARESLHYSIQDVADRLKRDPSVVADWENGESSPTFAQLEKLAYEIYKRPLAVFFLPSPPEEPEPRSEFRMLPDSEMESLNWHTFYMIRLAHSLQDSLRELNDGKNRAERRIFADIHLDSNSDIESSAQLIRDYLNVSIDAQIAWKTVDQALKNWRRSLEDVGIYVFKNSFRQKNVSAFCLTDDQFPIIYLNNSTAKTRQIFSIFHELIHLLMHQSDVVSLPQFSTESPISQQVAEVEKFCNEMAAEIIFPSAEAERVLQPNNISDQYISRVADIYSVSREVVLRRMVEFGYATPEQYREKVRTWSTTPPGPEGSGGSYYATQATYLGQPFLSLVLRRHEEGRITTEQAAEHLNVKVRSLPGLEKTVYQENAA